MKTTGLRAGAKKNDIANSGFARVEILGQEELFPKEGYEFPPGKSKLTNSYRMSEDSPFTTQTKHTLTQKTEEQKAIEASTNELIRTERLCTKTAALVIATGNDGEVRPIHGRIAEETVLKQRKQQLLIKEQVKIAKMKDDQHWAEVEQEEANATNSFLGKTNKSKKEQQQALAEVYKKELELHKQKAQEEAEQNRKEAERLSKIEQEENEKEKKRLELKKQKDAERVKEYKELNDKLLNRKKLKRVEEAEAEKKTQEEHTKILKQMEEREEKQRKIREEKNQRRERLIEIQTKQLSDLKSKETKQLEIAASELEKRKEEETKRKQEKDLKVREDTKKEWKQSLIDKQDKLMDKKFRPKTPPQPDLEEDARAFDAMVKSENMKKIREQQRLAAEQRKNEEKLLKEKQRNTPETCYILKDNEDW